jgi:hypothetical protein
MLDGDFQAILFRMVFMFAPSLIVSDLTGVALED